MWNKIKSFFSSPTVDGIVSSLGNMITKLENHAAAQWEASSLHAKLAEEKQELSDWAKAEAEKAENVVKKIKALIS